VVGESAAVGDVDRLRLLATAIAGRTLEVAVADAGERTWTDASTVFVEPHASPADQVRMVAVQASLVGAGSLESGIVRKLGRGSGLARRYLAVEGHRALATNEVLPPVVRSLVDLEVAGSVGGSEDSLGVARARQAIDDPPASFGVIRPRRLLTAAERIDAPAGTPDQVQGRPQHQTGSQLDGDDADEADWRRAGHLVSSPVGGRGALGRLLKRMLSTTREPGAGGPVGADAPARVGRARTRGHGKVTPATLPEGAVAQTVPFEPRGRNYPEWDVRRRRYRPDWCTVLEHTPRPRDLAPMVVPDVLPFRRPLARLGSGLDRTRRRPQGDDIDIDAAVEARVELLAGSPPDEAVYVESLRRRRDLAVLILLDISGSAGEPGPAGRPVHHHQRSAAAALATALHDLGDRVAVYAFNSHGRRAVHVRRVKGFDDRFDARAVLRLGGLVPGAYTRLGAAIRHGASVLEERGGTSRRLLVVLSDGFAYDHGYGGRYGETDARRALAEARRRGLGCLCLSVGAGTAPAALRRVFGTAAHATVPLPALLPGLVGPLIRAALRSADTERRAFQRKERTRGRLELDTRMIP
jgi:nitric oxide reductase NorD protein